jgi:NAD(P)-dependent dehydrogenase (short-subunit alcohol dehydrogenase family)
VFANAGISAGPGPGSGGKSLLELDDENWERVLAVNLSGVIRTARAALPYLIESGSGRLIITSSSAAIMPTLFVGHAYAASKAAVHHLTQYLAMELAEHKVLVNCLAPGPFETNIASGRLKQPDIAEQVAKSVPLGRIADPSEIGPVALLLASPDNAFMTGSLISIDGGTVAGNWSH